MASDVAVAEDDKESKAKVFISYSRKDSAFADRLDAALKARGFEPLIDRTDIYAFEEWWKRVEALIGRADTVVFVLSPDAVRAESVARKEVTFAASLNKRFAPIIYRPVEDKFIPEELAKLNFIFFDEEMRFKQGADQLAVALNTDIGWIRQHTDFGEQARRWVAASEPTGLLLRSPALEQAERWIASRPPGAPMPTEQTQVLIRQSRQAATRRRNIVSGSLAVGLVLALSLAGIAYWQRSIAVEQRDAALVAQSRFLVGEAEQQMAADDPVTAQLLAIEGLPDATTDNHRPLVPELAGALVSANFARRELAILPGHKQPVRDVAFSPDGRRILTASWDVAHLWDVNTGERVATLKGHNLVAGPADFIDEMTGQPVAELRANRIRVFNNTEITPSGTRQLQEGYDPTAVSAVFSPNGKLIATSTPENKVIVWDAGSTSQLASLEGHKRLVRALTFSPDSLRIATASDDGTAKVWNSATGALQATLVGHSDWLTTIVFSPNGEQIATGSEDGSVRIWSVKGGPAQKVLRGPSATTGPANAVLQVAFSHDGLSVLAACADNTARIWTLANGAVLALAGHTGVVTKARFNADSTKVVTSSWDQTVRVWDAVTGELLHTLSGHAGPVEAVEFNMDGTRILTASRDKTARIWNADTGASVALLRAHTNELWMAQFSPDGQRIVTGSDDATARVWDAAEHAQVRELGGLKYGAFVSFSPDGTRLVAADGRARARRDYVEHPRLWSMPDGALIADLKGKTNDVARAVFSPDGSRFAFASQSRLVLVDAKTGAVIADREAEGGYVYLISFSPDGRRLLKVSNTSCLRKRRHGAATRRSQGTGS
jgi:WD40 repeat protein